MRRRLQRFTESLFAVALGCLGWLGPFHAAAQTPSSSTASESPSEVSTAPPPPPIPFTEVAAISGLDFAHWNGMSGRFYFPEVVGSGGALFDYDNDGDLDIYLVQGRFLGPDQHLEQSTFPPPPLPAKDRLFRNDTSIDAHGTPRLRFTDVTEASRIEALHYGMGAYAADVDGDGDQDLYLTNFGPNELWRNRGDGTFEEVAAELGLDEKRWSVAASFLDYDRDGWLDLFVGNYMDYQVARNKSCVGESGLRDYCGPQSYEAISDRLWRNRGDGTFEDITRKAGLQEAFGPALGSLAADFNGDGHQDLYVANDQAANQLWLHQGDSTFFDDALLMGAAVNRDGQAEASMGVDAADFDGDGDLDLFMTHLTRESHTLYVNDGSGQFRDRTTESGLATASWQATGFGTAWFDVDNDGHLDLFTANGSVYIDFELARQKDPYPLHQPNQLFRSLGNGTFEEMSGGEALELSEVSRGAMFGDLDNDGDTDVVVTNNSGPVRLLRNDVGDRQAWIGLRLVDEGSANRDALGARVAVRRPDDRPTLWRRVRVDGSYASSSDPRILVGLGDDEEVLGLDIFWPDGTRQSVGPLPLRQYHPIRKESAEDTAKAASQSPSSSP